MENRILVAVFSASGVTKRVGEAIARACGADFYEIVPKDIYTSADLDWMNKKSRSSIEMNDPSARPEIAGSGTWKKGKRFSGSVSEEELRSWIEGLK